MRTLAIAAAFVVLASGVAQAQEIQPATLDDDGAVPSTTDAADETGDWSFSMSAYTYVIPDDRDYVQPTLTADRDWLHLEARYNYEALDTGSAWVGYNLSFGDELTFELTAMLGGVFGELNGVAPGYELTLSYWRLELYSEGEYVFDLNESSESFFYTWSEFTYSPLDWLRVGAVIQRTKVYETDFDIQRGLLLGVTYKQLDFAAYVLNPDDEDPVFVFSVGLSF